MKNIYLDEITKDLEIGTNDNWKFTEDNTEFLSQKIENRLLFVKNEWFLNRELGIPYWDVDDRRNREKNIMIKNPDLNFANSIFQSEILKINGVEEILEFDTSYNTGTRTYSISFSVRITTGIITSEVIV